MLTPDQIDQLATDIVSGHQEAMVARLMRQLITALASDGALTVRDMHLLDETAARLAGDVNQTLATYQPRIRRETQALVTAALTDSDDGDVEILSRLYPGVVRAGASAAFNRIAQETAHGLALIISRDNLKMAYGAQRAWYEVAGEAITRWNHGEASQDRIIADAVDKLMGRGFTTIDYRSGVSNQIDVAVRRHIVTQVGQAAGRMTEARMEQYGHDLVFTSSHFGARPDHAAWQGKAFSLSGKTKGYPDFASATGYGTGAGLLGWNCGHTYGPYFEGITELPKLPERVHGMTNDEMYEATQKQRGYERAIRKTKREIAALEEAGQDPLGDATVAKRLRLGAEQRRAKKWAGDKKLTRRPKLEKAYGIGDSRPRALRTKPGSTRYPTPLGRTVVIEDMQALLDHIVKDHPGDAARAAITPQRIAATLRHPEVVALNPPDHVRNPGGWNFYSPPIAELGGKRVRIIVRPSDMSARTGIITRRVDRKSGIIFPKEGT